MRHLLALCLASALLAACASEGRQYKAELVKTIQRSDSVVVTEHSFQYDLYDQEAHASLIPDQVVYSKRALTPEQRSELLSVTRELNPTTQNEFSMCIFEPHHALLFYANDKLLSTMEICFKCKQVEWDGSKLTPPGALYAGLGAFLQSIGFEPTKDWTALAEEYRRSHPVSTVDGKTQ